MRKDKDSLGTWIMLYTFNFCTLFVMAFILVIGHTETLSQLIGGSLILVIILCLQYPFILLSHDEAKEE